VGTIARLDLIKILAARSRVRAHGAHQFVPDTILSMEPVVEVRLDAPVKRLEAERAWVHERLVACLAHVPHAIDRVTVEIIDDHRMAALHERFSKVSGTTDVLTFPSSGPGEPVEVDIAICVDEAARQSRARGQELRLELLLYALHGVLHCVGFDDRTADDHARMHAEEDRILQAIGLGAVYAREERS
jgi:probable rRNA maturation factor